MLKKKKNESLDNKASEPQISEWEIKQQAKQEFYDAFVDKIETQVAETANNKNRQKVIDKHDFKKFHDLGYRLKDLKQIIENKPEKVWLDAHTLTSFIKDEYYSDIELSNFKTLNVSVQRIRNSSRAGENFGKEKKRSIVLKNATISFLNISLSEQDYYHTIILENCDIDTLYLEGDNHKLFKKLVLDNCQIETMEIQLSTVPEMEIKDTTIKKLNLVGNYLLNSGKFLNSKVYNIVEFNQDGSLVNQGVKFHHEVIMDNFIVYNSRYNNNGTLEDYAKGSPAPAKKLKPDVNF